MIGQLQNKFEASVHFHGGMGVVRKFFNSVVISLIMLLVNFSYAGAQLSLKDLSVNYNELRLDKDKGYSIMYDNLSASAKLNEFKIKFYKDSTFVDETAVETFPANGTIISYGLRDSVIGFNKAELSIISLHTGNITDFPSSAASIIALNEPTEIKPTVTASTPTQPVNRPPIAQNTILEIGATIDTLTRSITDEYSDPDGDILTVVETSKAASPLSYQLFNNGTLTLTAPSVTGTYTIPYEVRDRIGASASAEVSIIVIFPKATASSLTQYIEDAEQLLSNIDDKKTELSNLPAVSQALIKRRENLLADNKSLESKASDPQLLTLKTDISELTEALELSKNATSVDDLLNSIGDLNTESLALQDQLQALQSQSLEEGLDISNFKAELTSLAESLDTLKNKEKTLIVSSPLTLAQMEKWESQYQLFKQQIPSPPLKWLVVALVALALGGVGLMGLTSGRRRQKKKTPAPIASPPFLQPVISKDNVEKGMVFAPSQMMVGGSSLPLSLAAIQPAYNAVGRIGFAQEGKPVGKDEAFGTGILISDTHVLTNRHVWEMFKHRLAGDEGTGIEFYGLKKSDKSEFVEFDGVAPVCIEGWDAAIFTLKHAPENRRPVSMTPRPAEELNDLDIVVVGYPQAYRISEEIEQVTEDSPIFGVKRYSEGKIFKHSTDDGNPYGVETLVDPAINSTEYMPAICHNASTLGGSSGSAIICKKTGDLIALHFGFDSALEWEEAANLGVAGENIAEAIAKITKVVTDITDAKPLLNNK